MATVYLAIQESLERSVVLKTLNMTRADSEEVVERFINEGRMIASLRHPHIITIFDIGTVSDVPYIAMEYVEGGDLKRKMRDRILPDVALDILEKIGGALDLAHQQGIVHRDVKPGNILFRGDGTPLLSDFGIAKHVRIDAELTSTGTVLGSPFYMSPEQAEGDEVDGRSDIYSLGIIFYEMLMGCRPYVGESAIKIILHHIQAPIPRLPKDLSRFQPLLNRMMAKEPKDRLPDAATLVEEVADLRKSVSEASKQSAAVAVSPASASERPVDNEAIPEAIVGIPAQYLYRSTRTLWMLLSSVALLAVGCVGFYLYTESLTKSAPFTRPHADRSERSGATEFSPSVTEHPAQSPAGLLLESDRLAGTAVSLNGGAPVREDVLKALSWLAQHSLREGRLTIPAGDNANYYFHRILALEPDNEIALKGLSDIAERYVVLAEQQFAQKNYQQARAYIEEGLQQQANNQGLLTLQSIIEKREKSMVDKLVEFFTGKS